MDPLDGTEILAQGARRILGEEHAPSGRGLRPSSNGSVFTVSSAKPVRSLLVGSAPRVTILKAEQLLQIVATAQPTPISRQIAAAAYIMEAQAQQELARMRRLSSETGREWFA